MMRRPRVSLLFVVASALIMIALQKWEARRVYYFGHFGLALEDVERGLLIGLVCTHLFLATIMWVQRRQWDNAEAGMFRFICVKALFWGYFAWVFSGKAGISLPNLFLLAVMILTTGELDVELFRRHILRKRDAATDARQGDAAGTASAERARGYADGHGT